MGEFGGRVSSEGLKFHGDLLISSWAIFNVSCQEASVILVKYE